MFSRSRRSFSKDMGTLTALAISNESWPRLRWIRKSVELKAQIDQLPNWERRGRSSAFPLSTSSTAVVGVRGAGWNEIGTTMSGVIPSLGHAAREVPATGYTAYRAHLLSVKMASSPYEERDYEWRATWVD